MFDKGFNFLCLERSLRSPLREGAADSSQINQPAVVVLEVQAGTLPDLDTRASSLGGENKGSDKSAPQLCPSQALCNLLLGYTHINFPP